MLDTPEERHLYNAQNHHFPTGYLNSPRVSGEHMETSRALQVSFHATTSRPQRCRAAEWGGLSVPRSAIRGQLVAKNSVARIGGYMRHLGGAMIPYKVILHKRDGANGAL